MNFQNSDAAELSEKQRRRTGNIMHRLMRLKRYRKPKKFRKIVVQLLRFVFNAPYYRVWRRLHLRKTTHNLVSMSAFIKGEHFKPLIIAPESLLEICGPKFIGKYPIELHTRDTVKALMPKVEIIEFPAATVMSGTNLILRRNAAIHPDVLLLKRDVIPAEISGLAIIDFLRNSVSLFSSYYSRRTVRRAISLLGQCTGNYAHWLTETLPRLIIINEHSQFDGLPLIVDAWTHPIILETIKLLDSKKRELILLDRWKQLRVSSLVDISPTTYIPPIFRGFEDGSSVPIPNPDFYIFSQLALNKLRTAGCQASRAKKSFGRKLYLRRERATTGNNRFITNNDDVEATVLEFGFVSIDPANYSFDEQIAIFSDADCIVAPIGAALANAIFSSPGCRIVALSGYCENGDYYYSNLMALLGHQLHYVLGPQEVSAAPIFDRNYSIDIDALCEALIQMVR